MKLSTLQKGLVLHLPLDQQSFNPATKRFTDKSAYSNHGTGNGTLLGSVAPGFQADRMGQLVRAAPFNGTDDYINCSNDASLDITEAITISVWIKADSVQADTYAGAGISKNNYFIGVQDNLNNRILSGIQVSTTDYSVKSSLNFFDGTWKHTVMTYDGNTLILYVNNEEINSDNSMSGNIDSLPAQNVIIGAGHNEIGNFFDGSMADVHIYNRALSQAERTLLYESYRPGWKI